MKKLIFILLIGSSAYGQQAAIQFPDTTFIGPKVFLSLKACTCFQNPIVSTIWSVPYGSAQIASLGNQATIVNIVDSTRIAFVATDSKGITVSDTLTISIVQPPVKTMDSLGVFNSYLKSHPLPTIKQRSATGLSRDTFGSWFFLYDDGTKQQVNLKGGFVIQ